MRQLVLIRHAKSSWADPVAADIDRPLNERGRLAAPVTGAWLAGRGIAPDWVAISPARRCRETWERLRPQLPGAPEATVLDRLYMADPDTMLELLRAAPDGAMTAVMIGHQPGLSSFARKLAGGQVPAGCARAFTKFPTGAAALLDFAAERWRDIGFGSGTFRSFATPKELV